ncbi:MAG TPA: asparagine synthase C-terminal domain-containing protein, partial [Pirellulales bacterium]|nr:asparagine synthase C-terminal domain-containing protein [Pirellulales bacterium]
SLLEPQPLPTFTAQITSRRFDETGPAMRTARAIGSLPTVVSCGAEQLSAAYPRLVMAADCPVVDTACAALYLLAEEVHRQGFKVALTGEGSDEALAGYPWFKLHRLMTCGDIGRFRPSRLIGRLIRRLGNRAAPASELKRMDELLGGVHAQSVLYHLVSSSRARYYSGDMRRKLAGYLAYEDLPLKRERMARWHPLNQSIYLGYKTILPGLLLNHKGDRVAMAHSVETRYPFLDEQLIDFCARLAPEWKLRSLRRDKHVLRSAAAAFLPRDIVRRPKAMFRAPQAGTFFSSPVAYVEQLLSRESLARTEYFDVAAVRRDYEHYRRPHAAPGLFYREMGLTTVLAVQLWHHQYLGGGLCELPVWTPPQ